MNENLGHFHGDGYSAFGRKHDVYFVGDGSRVVLCGSLLMQVPIYAM